MGLEKLAYRKRQEQYSIILLKKDCRINDNVNNFVKEHNRRKTFSSIMSLNKLLDKNIKIKLDR